MELNQNQEEKKELNNNLYLMKMLNLMQWLQNLKEIWIILHFYHLIEMNGQDVQNKINIIL